ncbi:hypothetical protein EC844_107106 [Acinetobacter calcoaceticus]|uniref:Uncharacterized protein n=1 Tax=Acinetobacter calcoaceticus TaxID=471 RepID=A0A4R1XXA5_ACICA|nr:hypothetical protein EC844_107106 [Acinetobacter calcoaceticus]
MMFIKDTQHFPVVEVSYQTADAVTFEDTIAVYEALLDQQKNFVFISEGPFPEQQASHEERQKVAAWVKQKRSAMAKYVKAFVHIEPDQQSRWVAQKFANNFIKFSGYPMFIVVNKEQAQRVIHSVLKI